MRLAWWRLRYPTELGESAEKEYWAYLRRRAVPVARWLLGQGDTAGLQFLLSHTDWEKEPLTELVAAEGFDEVLVCYSLGNFLTDTNLVWLR